MRTEKFTPADQEAVTAHYSSLKKKFLVLVGAQVAMLGGVSVALSQANVEQWYLFIGAFVLSDIIVLMFFAKMRGNAKRDLEERMKISGTFKIIGRMGTKSTYSIMIEHGGPRKIKVNKKVYDRAKAGEDLYIEFAGHCSILLEAKQNEEVLYSASRHYDRQMSA